MATHTLRWEVTNNGTVRTTTKSYTGTLSVTVDGETVADSQTDQLLVMSLDVSAVKSFWMVSDQALTVETNDGTTPADTIVLVANVPYVWCTDSYDTFLLGTDVTALYLTNASGSTATLKIEAVVDPSP